MYPAHDPRRTATPQGIRRATTKQYYNMTTAEVMRHMSNADIDRNARRGGVAAIMEQAYRVQMREALADHNDELSEFERTCIMESEMRDSGGI